MARKGLNCQLSYTKDGKQHTYQVRATAVSHGMRIIYAESSARVRRVVYPHRLSNAQFAVSIELMGEQEYVSFNTWMAEYADYAISLDLTRRGYPYMAVTVPSRNFDRNGVPLSGAFEWGDSVGLMVRSQQIVFETIGESRGEKANDSFSVANSNGLRDQTGRFFYPTGEQLSGNAKPLGSYATAINLSDITGDSYSTPRYTPPDSSAVAKNPSLNKPRVNWGEQ